MILFNHRHRQEHRELDRRLDLLEARHAAADKKWDTAIKKIDQILNILEGGRKNA